jgi:hypothetical protein
MRAKGRVLGIVVVLAAVLMPATQATAAGGITVTPSTGLIDGQVVTVDGFGWAPGSQIGYCQAVQSDLPASQSDCDSNVLPELVNADDSGNFSVSLSIRRIIYVPRLARQVDCVVEECAVGAALYSDIAGTAVFASLDMVPGPPTVLPGGTSALEGDAATTSLAVPVTLSFASDQTVTVQWTTFVNPGNPPCQADPATDYTPATGTVTFVPGDTAETAAIAVNGDTLVEPDECIIVSFRNPTNARIGGFYGVGFGIVTNDDT